MGKIGKTYPSARAVHINSASALAHFDRPLTVDQGGLVMRHQITSEIFGLVCLLAYIGWVLAN